MARHFKSNSWEPRVSGSSGSVYLGRTDEALPRTSLVPIPVLIVGFKSTGIALTGAKNPVRPPQVVEQAGPPPAEEATTSGELGGRSEPLQTASDNGSEPAPTKDRHASTSGQGDSIDLIIDKLPRHALVKPIPVTISPLGDRVFIASTPDLDITVTCAIGTRDHSPPSPALTRFRDVISLPRASRAVILAPRKRRS